MTIASVLNFIGSAASLGVPALALVVLLFLGFLAFLVFGMVLAVRHGYGVSAGLIGFSFQPGSKPMKRSKSAGEKLPNKAGSPKA